MEKQFNPYSAKFLPNHRFEILFKDKEIVAEGRQSEQAIVRSTVDLLNNAFTRAVQDVLDQCNPVMDDYKNEIDELKQLLLSTQNELTAALNEKYRPTTTTTTIALDAESIHESVDDAIVDQNTRTVEINGHNVVVPDFEAEDVEQNSEPDPVEQPQEDVKVSSSKKTKTAAKKAAKRR